MYKAKNMTLPKFAYQENEEETPTLDGEIDDDGEDRIAKTFAGQVLFITGGTGFLGKVLVEKLLRYVRAIFITYVSFVINY